MIISEIKGKSIEDENPEKNLREILSEAGKQLALIHNVKVDGFGWIDKRYSNILKGVKRSFLEYYTEYLGNDYSILDQYDFCKEEKTKIKYFIEIGQELLNVDSAVLVHGDFDISQIFHYNNRYSGMIDFGEARGNNHLYDLATFVGFYQDRQLYSYLLEGYRERRCLTETDLDSVEIMGLFMLLRFLGKKVNAKSHNHFYNLTKRQLLQLEKLHF